MYYLENSKNTIKVETKISLIVVSQLSNKKICFQITSIQNTHAESSHAEGKINRIDKRKYEKLLTLCGQH